jgi:hypothetical protein
MSLAASQPHSAPLVCRRLRSKGAPGTGYGSGVGFDAGYSSTATFWCTATAGVVGPDDSYVHPHVCISARICFLSPSEQDRVS